MHILLGILSLLLLASCGSADVPKDDSTDFLSRARAAGYELSAVSTSEKSVLSNVASTKMQSVVLLKNQDRIAAVFWTQTNNAQALMNSVKKWAFESMSNRTHSVVSTDDRLEFIDPSVSEEVFVILRKDNTVFEVHVSSTLSDRVTQLL